MTVVTHGTRQRRKGDAKDEVETPQHPSTLADSPMHAHIHEKPLVPLMISETVWPRWLYHQLPRGAHGHKPMDGPHLTPGHPLLYYVGMMFTLHSETVNVWSHLVPFILQVLYAYQVLIVGAQTAYFPRIPLAELQQQDHVVSSLSPASPAHSEPTHAEGTQPPPQKMPQPRLLLLHDHNHTQQPQKLRRSGCYYHCCECFLSAAKIYPKHTLPFGFAPTSIPCSS